MLSEAARIIKRRDLELLSLSLSLSLGMDKTFFILD